jgi:hypothetical protein
MTLGGDLSLVDNDLSGSLVDFFTDVPNFAGYTRVHTLLPTLPPPVILDKSFAPVLGKSMYSVNREAYGPTPSTDQVMKLLEPSFHCDRNLHHGSSWNMEVYHRVLEASTIWFPSDSNRDFYNSTLPSQPVNSPSSHPSQQNEMGNPPFTPLASN